MQTHQNDENHSKPRLGALGVGWIGRHRMKMVADSGAADIVAIADPGEEARAEAASDVPEADVLDSFDALLERDDLDGLLIATPSAMHADQTIRALGAGLSVFCQKPLGRSGDETARVVEAAERADRLLGVDFSYRHTDAMRAIRERMVNGELGEVYAVDLVFHNAYGPDKGWFYDVERAGGGCVVDLGIHLVDLALWMLGWPEVEEVTGTCFTEGRKLEPGARACEDYCSAQFTTSSGCVVDLACSWRLPAGRDAVIGASFYGSGGGAATRNVDGSFYDFVAERYDGTDTERLVEPPDAWGGRAAVAWARQLAGANVYDPDIAHVVQVARTIDRIYGRAS